MSSFEYGGLPNINFSQLDFSNVDFSKLGLNFQFGPTLQTSNIRGVTGMRMFLQLSGAIDDANMEFYFPYAPAQMTISDLSSLYVEIDRPKSLPIVEFAGHKLMKFQIEFVLSHIGNGVAIPVDNHIEFFRKMATSKQGILFADGNKVLTSPLAYKGVTATTSNYFYITDMSVNAQRMTYDNRGIALASVSLSFTEARNPILQIVKMPKIKYTKTTPRPKRTKKNPKGKPATSYTNNETTTTPKKVGKTTPVKKK